MPKNQHKRKPPYRISVRPADVSPEKRENRLGRALDILVEEALRRRAECGRRS